MERLDSNSFEEKLNDCKSNSDYIDTMMNTISYSIYNLEFLYYSLSPIIISSKNFYEISNIIKMNKFLYNFSIIIDPEVLSATLMSDSKSTNNINTINYIFMVYTDKLRSAFINKEKDIQLYISYSNYIKDQIYPIIKLLENYMCLV